ncbi:histidine kinase [Draconibacterium sp. IB214405]|uniref:histidine kinase n=1 Tax=Draconibacterium sp. IB214405 TaxID=3097352 RepID=UPI002A17BAB5|nr:histidine kinase [Draconibacterium sp. IB214405]MDX8340217.1 histidine kinase [Draconibacterium sp. IB214405]
MRISHITRRTYILHVIFWLAWVISFTFIQTLNEGVDSLFIWLMYYLITLPVFVVHTYLIAYWLLPITFFKNRYLWFAIGIFALLVVFSVIELLVSNYLVYMLFDESRMFDSGFLNFKNIVISGVGNHYIILVFLAIKAGSSWYRAENQKEELLRSTLETELEIFRYQLQPKIVLVLINELELLTQKGAEHAPEMIINISNFLNRFLFEGKEELIPLEQDVKLLEEFMAIHNHALDHRLTNNFIVSGNLKSYVVPPLLLLPFINSAIKIAYECNENYESTVIIKAERKYLLFSFTFWSENNFTIANDEDNKITYRRLHYNFPGKHRLVENIDDNFREFSIEIYP